MSAPIIALMLLRTEREIVEELRAAGATSLDRAILLPAGKSMRRGRIKVLAKAGVLRTGAEGAHYLSEDAWRDYETARRKRSWLIVAAMVLLLLVGLMFLRVQ